MVPTLAILDHPLAAAIEFVRIAILTANPEVGEAIKWNSPSFYFQTPARFFATINTHSGRDAKPCLRLIFHQGAKVKNSRAPRPEINDPNGLLEWLGTDRCSATFNNLEQVKANRAAIQDIVRQWIALL